MAWTAPRTWTTGELVTASIGNTHWRDNLLETAPAKVTTAGDTVYATGANALARLGIGTFGYALRVNSGATAPEWARPAFVHVRRANTQTITTDSWTNISWDTEVTDDDSYYAGGAPTRVTLGRAGLYAMAAWAQWIASTVGMRGIKIERYNSSDVFQEAIGWQTAGPYSSADTDMVQNAAGITLADANDYILTSIYQKSGGDLNLVASRFKCCRL